MSSQSHDDDDDKAKKLACCKTRNKLTIDNINRLNESIDWVDLQVLANCGPDLPWEFARIPGVHWKRSDES